MKRVLALLLATVMMFALCACGNSSKVTDDVGVDLPKETVPSNYTSEDFIGDWINVKDNSLITITKDFSMEVGPLDRKRCTTHLGDFSNGQLVLSGEAFGVDTFKIEEKDGAKMLVGGELEAIWHADYISNATKHSVGDTASSDCISITVTGVDYINKIDARTANPITNGSGLGAGDGQIFAHICFNIENNSKDSIRIPGTILFTIDYNNGFQFTTKDNTVCYFKDKDASFYYEYCAGAGSGSISSLNPLTSGSYELYLPVAEVVSTDTTNPLLLIVGVPTTTGYCELIYSLR